MEDLRVRSPDKAPPPTVTQISYRDKAGRVAEVTENIRDKVAPDCKGLRKSVTQRNSYHFDEEINCVVRGRNNLSGRGNGYVLQKRRKEERKK